MGQDRSALTEPELAARLTTIPGWRRVGATICREWVFVDFQEAFGFLTRVALLAEKADHHPEIRNVWNRVELVLSTHDVGGLTALDFELAQKINKVAV